MRDTRPPRVAAWLFDRLASGPNRESLGGDLAEQYRRGRSSAWYWRQAIGSILAGTARDVSDHKLLALRAVTVGFASLWIFWGLASVPLRVIWVLSIVLFVVTPISALVGGFWTDYGTRTTGARQNATF